MKRGLTHDEAMDAIVGALSVTVMSYQEAIESYLMLRRFTDLFTTQAALSFENPQIRDASGMEARRAAAENTDAVHDSPAAESGDAQ